MVDATSVHLSELRSLSDGHKLLTSGRVQPANGGGGEGKGGKTLLRSRERKSERRSVINYTRTPRDLCNTPIRNRKVLNNERTQHGERNVMQVGPKTNSRA